MKLKDQTFCNQKNKDQISLKTKILADFSLIKSVVGSSQFECSTNLLEKKKKHVFWICFSICKWLIFKCLKTGEHWRCSYIYLFFWMPEFVCNLEPVLRRLHSVIPKYFLTLAQGLSKQLFLKWKIERRLGVRLMGVKELFVARQILQN